jgi:flagellar biosynthesis protein FlhA
MSDVQKVLQQLLAEKVSIRNIALILETLVDHGKRVKAPEELAECVRESLGRTICEDLLGEGGELKVLTFDPAVEHILQSGLRINEGTVSLLVEPRVSEQLMAELGRQCESMMLENLYPVLICSRTLRRHVKALLKRVLPHLSVLALNEIPTTVNISSYAVVRVDRAIIDQDRLSRLRDRPDAAGGAESTRGDMNLAMSGGPVNA